MPTDISHSLKKLALLGAWVIGVLLCSVSEPVAQTYLADSIDHVDVDRNCMTVVFVDPLQYLSHHPPSSGEHVVIQLRTFPSAYTDDSYIPERQVVANSLLRKGEVEEVEFDPGEFGVAYLIVRFSQKISFDVAPGGDGRSIRILNLHLSKDRNCLTKN